MKTRAPRMQLFVMLSICTLLSLCAGGDAQAWPPWSGTGITVTPYAGGGSQQGIPPSVPYAPPTYGTGTPWASSTVVAVGAVYVPSGAAGHLPTGWGYQPAGACTTGSTEPFWCTGLSCTVGDTAGGGTCTWKAVVTVSPIPSTWQVALDFDWTQGSSTLFSVDGATSFGGLTFTKFNSANDSACSAGGGTGLVITTVTGSVKSYQSATRSSPGMFLPFSGVSGMLGFSWRTPLRVWLQFASCTAGSADPLNDGMTLAIVHSSQLTSVTGSGLAFYNQGFSFDGVSGLRTHDQLWYNGAIASDSTQNQPAHATPFPFTMLLELPFGLIGGSSGTLAVVNSGAGISAWPGYQNLLPFVQLNYGGASVGSGGLSTFGVNNASNTYSTNVPTQWGVALVESTQTSANTCTVNRMRIDYKPDI